MSKTEERQCESASKRARKRDRCHTERQLYRNIKKSEEKKYMSKKQNKSEREKGGKDENREK